MPLRLRLQQRQPSEFLSQNVRATMVKVTGCALFAGVIVLVPSSAFAQNAKFSEGPGVKVSDQLELHLGVNAEAGYDSNWFQRSSRAGLGNSSPISGGMMRITPSVSLATTERRQAEDPNAQIAPPSFTFRTDLSATYREYFGPAELRDQRNVSLQGDLKLDIFPKRPWTLALNAGYVRSIRPSPSNSVGDGNFLFSTSNPYAGAKLIWTPNNGTFDATLGYALSAILFEQSAGAPFSNLRHEFTLTNKWQFRPKTAFFHDSSVGLIRYLEPERAINQLTNAIPVRSRVGINGLFTSRVAGLAAVGYGGTFFETGRPSAQQFDSVIAQAELRWLITQPPDTAEETTPGLSNSSLFLGFLRDFETSYVGDYVANNRVYAGFSYQYGNKFLATLNGGVGFVAYPNVFLRDQGQVQPAFTVVRPGGQLYAEYKFNQILSVNATFTYTQRISDVVLNYGGGAGGSNNQFGMDMRRVEAFGGVRLAL
jgi:hypothetical protein